MKMNFFLLMFSAIISSAAFSQNVIEDCNGDRTKRLDLLEKSVVFNFAGINLNKYDWSNPTVNCHINETISNFKAAQTMNYLGWGGVGGGVGLLTTGAAVSNYGSGGGFIVGGLLLAGGGIYAIIQAKKKKKKYNHHLNQVGEYYRQKGWY